MPTFDELQGKLVAALGILLVSWGGYITSQVIEAPSPLDVEKMIDHEGRILQKSIQDLSTGLNKMTADHERLKEGLSLAGDKVTANTERIWSEITLIKIEIEKVKLRHQYDEDQKKKMKGSIHPKNKPVNPAPALDWWMQAAPF